MVGGLSYDAGGLLLAPAVAGVPRCGKAAASDSLYRLHHSAGPSCLFEAREKAGEKKKSSPRWWEGSDPPEAHRHPCSPIHIDVEIVVSATAFQEFHFLPRHRVLPPLCCLQI